MLLFHFATSSKIENIKACLSSELFMSKAYELRFRVDRGQYERVKHEAALAGSKTLAGYFRKRVLSSSFSIEQKIIESHAILKRLEEHFFGKVSKVKFVEKKLKGVDGGFERFK